MPTFDVTKKKLSSAKTDCIVIGATGSNGDDLALAPGADEVTEALKLDLASELGSLQFDGSVGSTVRIPTRGALAAPTVLVVGLGDADDVTLDDLRTAAAAAAQATSKQTSIVTTLAAAGAALGSLAAAQAVVEGVLLGGYRYLDFKSKPEPAALKKVSLHLGELDRKEAKAGVAAGEATGAAACLTRDLVNLPPADKRPPAFADRVKELFKGTDVKVKILTESALEKGGYGGLLGVGRGSDAPPRLVELTYDPSGASDHIALVGKGITFDSGGLSLKPPNSMVTMKMDMAGAASVVGIVHAAEALGLKVKITGLLALAENMPSGTATRPSDVLTIRGGKTVEVLNTDAEGRLVLADALVHAGERKPDLILDMATLTGAAVVATGPKIGCLMSTHDDLAEAIAAASESTGEPLWRLPLAKAQYGEDLKSDVADIKNANFGSGAGTIRAGLFLQEFVPEGTPWVHLDIAGLAWTDSASGYLTKGATGAPVRAVTEWLANR